MRNSFLVIVALLCLGLLSACQKDFLSTADALIEQIANSSEKTSIEVADLPTAINAHIDDTYFESFVETAFRVTNLGYEINMDDGNSLYFDKDSKPLRHKKGAKFGHRPCGDKPHHDKDSELLDLADLPETIATYISENYPDAEIKRAKLRHDQYWVGLTGHIILVFDEDGNFVEEAEFPHGGCHGAPQEIDASELPESISTYLSDNYSDLAITAAFTKNDGNRYIVKLGEGNDTIVVIFDADGNVLCEKMP